MMSGWICDNSREWVNNSTKRNIMMNSFKTQQEEFWVGEFGNEYSDRNVGEGWIASNTALFSKILTHCHPAGSLIEFGANIGLNLRAIRSLLPSIELSAIEINAQAVGQLHDWAEVGHVFHMSILDFVPQRTWDISLIKGVLIHINPNELQGVYEKLYQSSNRYIIVAEYYNPSPVEVRYRGHEGKLFKRDFAGELIDKYPDLRLVDYGFVWRRDPHFPQDDMTWFLLEKR